MRERQNSRINVFDRVVLAIGILVLAACSSGGGGGNAATSSSPTPLATAVGTPVLSASTATIGAAGGTLTSIDSRITISIPAGALAANTVIGIQPITNNSPGGVGNGYRLTPDGQTFQQPITLTFTYTDQEVSDTAPELLAAAFQTADGYWQRADMYTVDTTAKTITVTTTHFSDWVKVEQFRLTPSSASVRVNDVLGGLQVEMCFDILGERPANGGERPLLGYHWQPIGVSTAALIMSNWSVNSIPGGNSTVGTLYTNIDRAGYTAPATKPNPATVAVSVQIKDLVKPQVKGLLISNITIIDNRIYTGTLNFSLQTGVTASASVTWTMFEDLGDTRRYLPSGAMTAEVNIADCDPYYFNGPIKTSTPAVPHETLVVYTATNAAYAKQYQFVVAAAGDMILQCGGPPRQSITLPAASYINVATGCTGPPFSSFTDENILTGTKDCSVMGLLSSSWTFTAQ